MLTGLGQAAGAAIAALILVTGTGNAQEADFLSRFEGSWTGSGMVQRKPGEEPNKVTCTMTGNPSENGVSMSGTCRAYLIFSREIGADITFDPSSGRYTGTYTGSTIGAAALSGKRDGDSVNLTITWPREVRGDTEAAMRIRNSGDGGLSITVSDQDAPGGPTIQVTDISLTRK